MRDIWRDNICQERKFLWPIMENQWRRAMFDPHQRESYFKVLELKKELREEYWPEWMWDTRALRIQERIEENRENFPRELEDFMEGSFDILQGARLELEYWRGLMEGDPSQKHVWDYLENIERCQMNITEQEWLLGEEGAQGPPTHPPFDWQYPEDWKENYFQKYAKPSLKCTGEELPSEEAMGSPLPGVGDSKRKREGMDEIPCYSCFLTELYSPEKKKIKSNFPVKIIK